MVAPSNWTGDPAQPVAFLNVAADETGRVYVANLSSVLIYDAASGARLGAVADPTGTVLQYDDVEPAPDGNVWVADSRSFTVYLLDPTGNILTAIPSTTADSADPAMAANELGLGPGGNLYVMYSGAGTLIQVFTPDGVFVRSFPMGSALSSCLIDFAFGPDGNLYIAGGMTVRVLDTAGEDVSPAFAPEVTAASTAGIRGIAVDSNGDVYVGVDSYAEDPSLVAAVYQLDPDGQLLAQFGRAQQRADWGNELQPEELGFTVSLAVLSAGQLVISDLNGGSTQLLQVTMPGYDRGRCRRDLARIRNRVAGACDRLTRVGGGRRRRHGRASRCASR